MTGIRNRKKVIFRSIAIGISGVVVISLVLFGRFQSNHNIPNPYWGIFNPTYTYAVNVGPPAKDLLDSRPETIVAQYIQDYIAVAGTYPCTSDFPFYDAQIGNQHYRVDPVLDNKPCLIKRQVQQIAMQSVRVTNKYWTTYAYVTFTITYVDGESWTHTQYIIPQQTQSYFRTFIHLTCWYFLDELDLYDTFSKTGRSLPTTKGLSYTVSHPYRSVCNT